MKKSDLKFETLEEYAARGGTVTKLGHEGAYKPRSRFGGPINQFSKKPKQTFRELQNAVIQLKKSQNKSEAS